MKTLLMTTMIALSSLLAVSSGHGAGASLVIEVDPMVADLDDRHGEDFEARFLAYMIHHARFGIRLAGLAEDRAGDAAIKQWAEASSESREREIARMEEWLEQWHPRKPGEDQIPHARMEKERRLLAELEGSKGDNYDELLSARLRAHHDTSIRMARMAVDRAIHEDVKAFARTLILDRSRDTK